MFYEKLTAIRKKNGLSQEALGEKVGVTRQTVSKWELGLTTPELDKLIELSRVFGCTVDYLIGKDDVPMPENTDKNTTITTNENIPENKPQEPIIIKMKPEYEYKSKTTLFGLPLVHIHFGFGLCRAKGIIAIGNIATGIVALGGISIGALSLGGVALGLFAIAGVAFGLIALGGLSVAVAAFGGIAVGVFAVGGIAMGVYSIGGVAIASDIAAGGLASGHIAIGGATYGEILFNLEESVFSAEQIQQAILVKFPKIWRLIVNIFSLFGA